MSESIEPRIIKISREQKIEKITEILDASEFSYPDELISALANYRNYEQVTKVIIESFGTIKKEHSMYTIYRGDQIIPVTSLRGEVSKFLKDKI